jgi:hypothetical protein
MAQDEKLRAIWKQSKIPVIYRQGGSEPLLVRLPYSRDNRAWLKEKPRQKDPEFFDKYKCWKVPKSRFDDIIIKALTRYDQIYVIQPYRVLEICSSSCMNATGFECECSCMGANHGTGVTGSWYEISETLAVQWHAREYACRLIKRSDVESSGAAALRTDG